jgi:hypothetical protein
MDSVLLVGLDHDALSRALLSGFNGVLDQGVGDPGQTASTVGSLLTIEDRGRSEMFLFFLDNPKPIIATKKYIRSNFLADPVPGA